MTNREARTTTKAPLPVRERAGTDKARQERAPENARSGVTDAQHRALAEATQTYTDMVTALAGAGIYMPELHIDMDERSSDPQHMMILGWVSMGSARKLVRILEAARP